MQFGIISGSSRKNNPQSAKVASYIERYLSTAGYATYLLDLAQTTFKYWDESFWDDPQTFDHQWTLASQQLHLCDGIVIVAPEWNGMLPPALVNLMHLAVKGELANKPVLVVTVSAAVNGVYPVIQLRNSGKNSFANFIPQHVIVRNVNQVLNDYALIQSDEDKLIRERLEYSLNILTVYADGFIKIRNAEIIKNIPFSYGM